MDVFAKLDGMDELRDSPDSHKCLNSQACPECTSLTPILKHILQHLTESSRHKSTDLSVPHDAGFSQKLSWYFECESCSYKSFYHHEILKHTRETHTMAAGLAGYPPPGSFGGANMFAPPPLTQGYTEARFSRKRLNPRPHYSSYKRRYQSAATATVTPTSHQMSSNPVPTTSLSMALSGAPIIPVSSSNDDSNLSMDNNQPAPTDAAAANTPLSSNNAPPSNESTQPTDMTVAGPSSSTEAAVGVKEEADDEPSSQAVLSTDMLEDAYDSSCDVNEPASRQSDADADEPNTALVTEIPKWGRQFQTPDAPSDSRKQEGLALARIIYRRSDSIKFRPNEPLAATQNTLAAEMLVNRMIGLSDFGLHESTEVVRALWNTICNEQVKQVDRAGFKADGSPHVPTARELSIVRNNNRLKKLNQRRSRQTSMERQLFPLEVGLMSDEEEVGNEYITQPLPWIHPQLRQHIRELDGRPANGKLMKRRVVGPQMSNRLPSTALLSKPAAKWIVHASS